MLAQGGTAVGTGLNTKPGWPENIAKQVGACPCCPLHAVLYQTSFCMQVGVLGCKCQSWARFTLSACMRPHPIADYPGGFPWTWPGKWKARRGVARGKEGGEAYINCYAARQDKDC